MRRRSESAFSALPSAISFQASALSHRPSEVTWVISVVVGDLQRRLVAESLIAECFYKICLRF